MTNELAFSLGLAKFANSSLPAELHESFYKLAAAAIVSKRYEGQKVAADHSEEITKLAGKLNQIGKFFSGFGKSMKSTAPEAVSKARRSALNQRLTQSKITPGLPGQQKIPLTTAPLPRQQGLMGRLRTAVGGGMSEARANSPAALEAARKARAAASVRQGRAAMAAKNKPPVAANTPAATNAPAANNAANPAEGAQQTLFDDAGKLKTEMAPTPPTAPAGAGTGNSTVPAAGGGAAPTNAHMQNIRDLWNAGMGEGGNWQKFQNEFAKNPWRNAGYVGGGAYGAGVGKDYLDAMTGSDEYDYGMWDKIKMGLGFEKKPGVLDPLLPGFLRGYHAN
jgi:hypothetical protein